VYIGLIIIGFVPIAFRKFILQENADAWDRAIDSKIKDNEMKDFLSKDNLVISRYTIGFHISFQSRTRLSRFRSHVLAASKVTGDANCQIFYVTLM